MWLGWGALSGWGVLSGWGALRGWSFPSELLDVLCSAATARLVSLLFERSDPTSTDLHYTFSSCAVLLQTLNVFKTFDISVDECTSNLILDKYGLLEKVAIGIRHETMFVTITISSIPQLPTSEY